ncbi:DUF397 domain-containing protein [Streptomyces armeniacus]|uniref:DUF397 domain-containing protein n=1 Tax=Streptomyces armeniacus TaxID=83291 RepID=A0A345XP80_9ACTN|nr:DUF397 domain-containing protein [Streptomyces armeniacus]AXK33446.1 DUF397 domain-containing protein [Streptomyces armeniacus]
MAEHIQHASALSGWRKSSYSGPDNDSCVEVIIGDASVLTGWRKSSYSSPDNDSCVEVIDGYASGIPVRDSKDPHGPALVVEPAAWSSFVSAVKRGEFPA